MKPHLEELILYQKYIKLKQFDRVPYDVLVRMARSVTVTTECCPEGLLVQERLGIVVAPAVLGMFIVRDWFAKLRDFFGGRSRASQKVVSHAGTLALEQLQVEAYKLGANAVIAIDLDYGQVSGKGMAMHQVVANGTAVKCIDISQKKVI